MLINTKNGVLFCRVIGQGKPLIVIHGGPGLSQNYLLPQMEVLKKNHFVIFYDQSGCGQSESIINSNTMNIATYLSDIEMIRAKFNLDKVSILGHSFGGFLAMHYAISYPNNVEKMILSNPMPASSNEYALFQNEWMKRMQPYLKDLEKIKNSQEYLAKESSAFENFYRIIFQTYFFNQKNVHKLNLQLPSSAWINCEKVYECFKTSFESHFNLHESLKLLKTPSLIIHGDFDPIPQICVQSIHENIKNSDYIVTENCGHFPYIEDPERYFDLIENFLSQTI